MRQQVNRTPASRSLFLVAKSGKPCASKEVSTFVVKARGDLMTCREHKALLPYHPPPNKRSKKTS